MKQVLVMLTLGLFFIGCGYDNTYSEEYTPEQAGKDAISFVLSITENPHSGDPVDDNFMGPRTEDQQEEYNNNHFR